MRNGLRINQIVCVILILLSGAVATMAQVPQLLNYQGRIAVNGTNFTGTGQFKFALVDSGSNSFWSNDGTSNAGGEPTTSVPLQVNKGLYSVLLGDSTLSNMTALPATVFTNGTVLLRVWFNDGTTGFQQLTPDQRMAAVGYAIMAGTVPDASITASKIAAGAVGSSQLAQDLSIAGTLTVSNLILTGSTLTSPSNNLSSPSNFQIPAGTNIQAIAGGFIFITNYSANIFLPTNANIGDTINIYFGNDQGSYNISQAFGQQIGNFTTVSGFQPEVACSADGTQLLISGLLDLFISTNAAGNLNFLTKFGNLPNPSIGSLLISPDGSRFLIKDSFHVLGSGDNGNTWSEDKSFSLEGAVSFACSFDGTKAFMASAYNGGIYTSIDSGFSWTLCASAPTNVYWASIASSADGTKLVALKNYSSSIYTSIDSGVTWMQQTKSPSKSAENLYWQKIVSSADGTKLVAVNSFNGSSTNAIYTSSDSGATWIQQANGLPTGLGFISVACSGDGAVIYCGNAKGMIYKSTDSGNTWSAVTTSQNFPITLWSAISSVGTSGGVILNNSLQNGVTLVYLGNGMFSIQNFFASGSQGY